MIPDAKTYFKKDLDNFYKLLPSKLVLIEGARNNKIVSHFDKLNIDKLMSKFKNSSSNELTILKKGL